MKGSALPPLFHDLIDEPVNRLAREARQAGSRILAYTCSYVPEPILSVDGLLPLRLRAPGIASTEMADTYLSSVLCSYTRSLLEFALGGQYDEIDGWVFASSCDHLRRLFDNLRYLAPVPFAHILDLPHKLGDEALAWYVEELESLASVLSGRFGVDTGPRALAEAIERQNECLALLRAIGDLRRGDNPPITGTDFHRLLVACATSPKAALVGALDELRGTLEDREGTGRWRARLLLVGSQLDDPGYIEVIESLGGLVVADRFCVGSIPGLEPIPLAAGDDPLRALAAHTLRKVSCPRMMEEFDSRVREVLAAARDFRADGVVIETMKFCDCWGVEGPLLVSTLREAGLPVLRLEREYRLTGEGQLRTRIQAFLESMGK